MSCCRVIAWTIIIIGFSGSLGAQDFTYTVKKVAKPPVIDGVLDDYCWAAIRSYPFDELNVKVGYDDDYLYIAASFPAIIESTSHKPWKWNLDKKAYQSSAESESSLTVVLSEPQNSPLKDLWIWRSCRTNPMKTADDYHILLAQKQYHATPDPFQPDAGIRCWYSQFFGKFAGYKLPRYYHRQPSGSAADVVAKGKWQKEIWVIEMKRRLSTGNPDDVDLSAKSNFELQVFIGLPLKRFLEEESNHFYLKFELDNSPEK